MTYFLGVTTRRYCVSSNSDTLFCTCRLAISPLPPGRRAVTAVFVTSTGSSRGISSSTLCMIEKKQDNFWS